METKSRNYMINDLSRTDLSSDKYDYYYQIEKRLQSLSIRKICFFTWLCGVRVLPLLGADDGYRCLSQAEKNQFLLSVFHVLDGAAQYAFLESNNVSYDKDQVINIRNYASQTSVYDNIAMLQTASKKDDYVSIAVAAVAVACRSATSENVAEAITFDMKHLFFKDINAIRNNSTNRLVRDPSMYGKLWDDFQNELRAIDCQYWEQLYSDIFSSSFQPDLEALRRRLYIPKSIQSLGAADVAKYLIDLATQKVERLNEARIIILGEKGAGKTSLAKKLIDVEATLPTIEESTEGVDVWSWKLDGVEPKDDINVRIWDFAGHAVTHTAHRYFLAERCIYIIVYDGRSERRNDLEKWLNHAKTYGGDSPIYVLINERDKSPVDIDEYMLFDKFQNIIDFVYISLRDDIEGMSKFRDVLENRIKKDPSWGSEIPAPWFLMKKNLEEQFSQMGSELIKTDDFQTIAWKSGIIEDDIERMKRALHALGVCLWYDKIAYLQDIVLNPNWISYGVYKIINWLGRKKDFKVNIYDFSDIFNDEKDLKRYPKEKHTFLFDLMKEYELAYPVSGKSTELILPSMLSDIQPERHMEDAFPIKNSLLMRYRVNGVMPLDTITRFIVRHHKEIVTDKYSQVVWRRGVSLHDNNGNVALVIENGLEIRLYVRGRTAIEYFGELRSTLNDIFQSYKSDNPDLEYAITETNLSKPVYATDGTILAFAINDRLYIEAKTGKEINMTNIKNQYNLSDSALIQGDNNNALIKSPNATVQLPASITAKHFNKMLTMLENFLESPQAEEMKNKDARALQREIHEAWKLGHDKKGWTKLRNFLSDSSNLVAIITPICAYLAAHPEIPKLIQSWFIR